MCFQRVFVKCSKTDLCQHFQVFHNIPGVPKCVSKPVFVKCSKTDIYQHFHNIPGVPKYVSKPKFVKCSQIFFSAFSGVS